MEPYFNVLPLLLYLVSIHFHAWLTGV